MGAGLVPPAATGKKGCPPHTTQTHGCVGVICRRHSPDLCEYVSGFGEHQHTYTQIKCIHTCVFLDAYYLGAEYNKLLGPRFVEFSNVHRATESTKNDADLCRVAGGCPGFVLSGISKCTEVERWVGLRRGCEGQCSVCHWLVFLHPGMDDDGNG